MSKLITVYLFHLLLVFPYLGYIAIQLDNKSNSLYLQQHGRLLKGLVFMGAIYQFILLVQYLRLIYG